MAAEVTDIKKNYKELLEKYKHRQDSNEFLKLQLQDMSSKLKQEQRDKDRLRDEVVKTRDEIFGRNSPIILTSSSGGSAKASPAPSSPFDWEDVVDKLQFRLKEAYSKLDEEVKQHEETKSKLEYTKQMLLVEGRTRVFLEERNSVLELKVKQVTAQGLSDMEAMCRKLQEANKQLEEEVATRTMLKQAKENLESEIEDLTKSLFEQANSMVSTEARQRHELEVAKEKLEQELEDTKNRLEIDRAVLNNLQEHISQLDKERKPHVHHRQTNSNTAPPPVAVLTALRVNSQPNLAAMETKGGNSSANSSLSSSPTALSPLRTSSGMVRDDFLKWRKRSKSLGDDAFTELEVDQMSPQRLQIQLQQQQQQQPQLQSQPQQPQPQIQLRPQQTLPRPILPQPHQSQQQQQQSSSSPLPQTPPFMSPYSIESTMSNESCVSTHSSESEGSDWEILEGGVHEDDDSIIEIEGHGRINTKSGLQQFVAFVTSPKQEWTGNRLMDRLLREDVGPCLRLRMQEDKAYRKLLEAVWNNKIFLEPLTAQQTEQATQCSACDNKETCRWRLRYSVDMEWKVIDDLCRERIIRACDFYSYLRNIRKGLVKKNLVAMYKEYVRLRMMMNFARICAG